MVFWGKLLRGGLGNGERDEEFNAKAQRYQRRKEAFEEEGAPIGVRLWPVGRDEEFNAETQRAQWRKEASEEEGARIGMRLWPVGETRNSTRRPKGRNGAKKH
jgi:hypothetical protein